MRVSILPAHHVTTIEAKGVLEMIRHLSRDVPIVFDPPQFQKPRVRVQVIEDLSLARGRGERRRWAGRGSGRQSRQGCVGWRWCADGSICWHWCTGSCAGWMVGNRCGEFAKVQRRE